MVSTTWQIFGLLVLQVYFWLLSRRTNFGSTALTSFLYDYSSSTLLRVVVWNLSQHLFRKNNDNFHMQCTLFTAMDSKLFYWRSELGIYDMIHHDFSSIFLNMKSSFTRWVWLFSFPIINLVLVSVVNYFFLTTTYRTLKYHQLSLLRCPWNSIAIALRLQHTSESDSLL